MESVTKLSNGLFNLRTSSVESIPELVVGLGVRERVILPDRP